MVRIAGLVKISHVTTLTAGRRALEYVVHVTLSAGNIGVCARQRELRQGVVVEFRSLPLCCGVAKRAILREAGSRMTGIHAPGVIREVARDAGR